MRCEEGRKEGREGGRDGRLEIICGAARVVRLLRLQRALACWWPLFPADLAFGNVAILGSGLGA